MPSKKVKTKTLKQPNEATGEMLQYEIELDPVKLRMAYLEVSKMVTAYEGIKDQLKDVVRELMGPDASLDAGNGYVFKEQTSERKSFDKYVLSQHLTEDQLYDVLKPDNKAVKNLLKELVVRGDIDQAANKAILEGQVVDTVVRRFVLVEPDKAVQQKIDNKRAYRQASK